MAPGSSTVADRPTAGRGSVSVARALGSSTRAGIYEHLKEADEPLTVRDVAGAFDLHPNVARTHLETLAEAGLVGVGLRKHAGGGRPAKLYEARTDVPPAEHNRDGTGQRSATTALLVRLLAGLLDGGAQPAPLENRAYDVAAAEGRRLASGAGGQAAADRTLEQRTDDVLRALRPHIPEVRVVKAGRDWVDVGGLRGTFGVLAATHAALAEALERGLLAGALAAAGVPVTVSDGGTTPSHGRLLRARAAAQANSRPAVTPVRSVDARGEQRETGVVRAMRAVTGLRSGEVLEVLAEGPGAPAAFARWADRAGHQLLGVERATDADGRRGIRLLIRKGA